MTTVTLRPRPAIALLAAALALTACSGAAPAPTATPAPSTPPAPTATASGGPVGYAAWVERQGFGGSSGLKEVAKETNWMRDNPVAVTAFDIQTTQRLVDHLATWLDENPATACWVDYHATVRAALGRMHDAYVTAHDARAAGNQVPADVVTALVNDAGDADALPAPSGC